MVSPFEIVILNLQKIGAFRFLFPFLLTSAIFYGLLRKSRLFGKPEENVAVNAVVAIVAAFMVWSYPILVGVNVETILSTFFFQGTLAMVIVIIGLLIVGMFVEPGKTLGEKIGSKTWIGILVFGLLVAFGLFFTSGVSNFFFPSGVGGIGISEDMITSIVVLIILGAIIVGVVWFTGKEEKKA